MKKTLKSLVQRLREESDGILQGGFGSIKGGFSSNIVLPNSTACTNDYSPGCYNSTNENVCVNSVDCSDATNGSACNNTGICLI